MKKKMLYVLISEIIIIVLILIGYVIFFFTYKEKTPVIVQETSPDITLLEPLIKAEVTLNENILLIKEEISLKEVKNSVCFNIPSDNFAHTVITKISSENGINNVNVNPGSIDISSSTPFQSISIEYTLTLDNRNKILSSSNRHTILTNFLITPAYYKDGEPLRTFVSDIGEPYVYDTYNYDVTVIVDNSLVVFAPGKIEEIVEENNKKIRFKAENLRDFATYVALNPQLNTQTIDDKTVYFINAEESADIVKSTMNFAESIMGEYPYSELFVIKTLVPNKQAASSQMIFISPECFTDVNDLQFAVSKAVIKQWVGGVLGTDRINEPYLEEGLSNYLVSQLYKTDIKNFVSDRLLFTPLSGYTMKNEYDILMQSDATAHFKKIHESMQDDFFTLLKNLYSTRKYQFIFNEDF